MYEYRSYRATLLEKSYRATLLEKIPKKLKLQWIFDDGLQTSVIQNLNFRWFFYYRCTMFYNLLEFGIRDSDFFLAYLQYMKSGRKLCLQFS